ncbi:MAG: PAS domain S-box protein [Bacteroidetes bacterium]|jgi:PAS domain S-box-containing protein|nr:PAS domain S-box protein [Bacteroidota bacterium]
MNTQKKRYRFFVIEDSRGDFILLEKYLNRSFSIPSVTRVATYAEAEAVLQEAHPFEFDAILLDLSLPDKSGRDLVDAVLDQANGTPIIVITGFSDLDFSLETIQKGVADYLLKDELSPEDLQKSILYTIQRAATVKQLENEKEEYKQRFENSPDPMLLVDKQTELILDVNQAAEERYGYSRSEFVSKGFGDLFYDDGSLKDMPERAPGNRSILQQGLQHHKKNNGDVIHVDVRLSMVPYSEKEAVMVSATAVANSNPGDEESDLLLSAINSSSEAVAIFDTADRIEESGIVVVNEAFSRLTDFSAREAKGETISLLFGENTSSNGAADLKNAIFHREATRTEVVLHQNDGTPFWADVLIDPMEDQRGVCTNMVMTIRDITEKKEEEEKVRKSLEEKELLLSEIHHRIKNNLALVSGMLQMQVFDEENEEVLNKLNNSMLRVETMASIHQLLYESSSFSRLEFSKIVDKLIKTTHNSFSSEKDIEFEIETEPFELNINQAVPCSLIINEAITNVYKHAFAGRDTGWIGAKLYLDGETVRFSLEDDGHGLPDDFDPSKVSSLGTKIVRALAKQLHGSFTLENRDEGGTRFTLQFPVKKE